MTLGALHERHLLSHHRDRQHLKGTPEHPRSTGTKLP
ncbi:hypothetical protein [Caudoviricetes sp.]|nr:hypothetical protein [Caudoviricetes sp.]